MKNVRNILAVVDPTTDEQVGVKKAATVAQQLGAHLHLFICDTPLARETRMIAGLARKPEDPLTTNLKPYLESLARPLREQGLDVTTDTAFAERLHDGLLDRIRSVCPDLVVKDTHHHSLARRTFMTNTDWELIRQCPSALLLAKPTAWASPPTVVAAIDPEHVNDKPALLDHHILEWGATMAGASAGTLHVAHAYIPLIIATTAATGAPPMGSAVTPELIKEEEGTKRKKLVALTQAYRLDRSNIHLSFGTATEVLPRFAQELNVDVMVMGAVARSALRRLLVGHTAERVLERLPCDALIIKPPEFDGLSEG